jgi:hypothetical protein
MDRVELVAMMSGGHGLPGDEAVEKLNRGTAPADQGGAGTTFVPGILTQPQGR